MKVAYFDTIGGLAGDMTLAAFISAGVQIDVLSAMLKGLHLGGFELQGSHVTRNGIASIRLDVVLSGRKGGHRHLRDIVGLIDKGDLSDITKERAKSIFRVLAEAEAAIHDSTVDRVHFHEVGAVDAIVDIVGTALCLEILGIERVYTSPVKIGSQGTVESEHGILPVPSPATIEILRGYPVVLTRHPHELTTPTGAAIVKALSAGVITDEHFSVESIGYGAGTAEFPDLPNLLRILVGELRTAEETDEVILVETNIDDMNPQIYPYVIERLLEAGALDAWIVPVVMKKGRPGVLLSALAGRSRLDTIVGVFHSETTTLGVRLQPVNRRKLPRSERTARTPFGPVRMKAILRNGTEVLTPEFEECRRIARERGIPLIEVYRTIARETPGRPE